MIVVSWSSDVACCRGAEIVPDYLLASQYLEVIPEDGHSSF